MLDILQDLVQRIANTRDAGEALALITHEVKANMQTGVCSVYLWDEEKGGYLLKATDGLKKSSIGKAFLPEGQGLVGEVAEQMKPLNLESAQDHPSYQFISGTGEEQYASFLGVPIVQSGQCLGVLTVQQVKSRRFDSDEVAFLVTISTQLAALILAAQVRLLHNPSRRSKSKEYQGLVASPGMAIGTAFVIAEKTDLATLPETQHDNLEDELGKFSDALMKVRRDLKDMEKRLTDKLPPQELELFSVYFRLLDDQAFPNEIITCMVEDGLTALSAIKNVILSHVSEFERMDDPYLRERSSDLRDLGGRLVEKLLPSGPALRDLPKDAILVGNELSAGILGEVPSDRIRGMVSLKGSATAHVAILARSMSIPTITGVELPLDRLNEQQIILDGERGVVIVNPAQRICKSYRSLIASEESQAKELLSFRDQVCDLKDGTHIHLRANTAMFADIKRAQEVGAEGVGLYRSEVPFMIRQRFPSEPEQIQLYRQQLSAFHPNPVTMRTLDVGGDKMLPYFMVEKEDNPFLGWRGIRVTQDHPEIFSSQIRAMLLASEGLNNLKILMPMVTSIPEVDSVLQAILEIYDELVEQGYRLERPSLGVMVEVPALLWQLDEVLDRVDFISVGSNDLTQYLLAVDRTNHKVSKMFDELHPSVLRALAFIQEKAHAKKVDVSLCGEMGGRLSSVLLLIGMGFRDLSAGTAQILRLKAALAKITETQCNQLWLRVQKTEKAENIYAEVEVFCEKHGLLPSPN